VVVDLAIDSQRDGLLFVDKRLSARVYGCELLLVCVCGVIAYRRRQCSNAHGRGLPGVNIVLRALKTNEHLLVSFATQLPPAISPSACCWRTQ
jgi:hypothetical protein